MTWTNCNIKTCPCFITSQSNAVLNDLKELGFKGLVKPENWEAFGKFIDEGYREVIEIIREGQSSVLDPYIKKKLFYKMCIGTERIKNNPDALDELKWQQKYMAENYIKNQAKKQSQNVSYEDDEEALLEN